MLETKDDIYVVICERDCPFSEPENHGPIVLETYLTNATKEKALALQKKVNGNYGECRIGRVIFKPKMIVPDWIRKIADKALCLEADKQKELLREFTLGLIDADKWEIENDEDYLQF